MKELRIVFNRSKGEINPNIYGHFSEHIGGVFYDGLWVGEDSGVENVRGFRKALVDSFRRINPPVLRWPGGCFAETYDWRDGIGPREKRPERVNWWFDQDGRTESNQVGTHEFIDFCRQVGAEPYFAANMTSVTPLHIRNWVEYCNMDAGRTTLARERGENGDIEPFGVRYWGIGNENWGGGGDMSPEMCAREFLRFSTIAASAVKEKPKFVICGANGHDIPWTRRLLKEAGDKVSHIWGMSVHYYCGAAGDTVSFSEKEWYQLLRQADFMRRIVDDHRAAMDEFDPQRKIGLIVDEWGCWHPGGTGPSKGYNLFEQQSTMRDAVVAALTLNIFNNRCDVVAMANVAQLCNNLHCLFLAGGEHFVETPTYFVYDLFKGHQGGKQLDIINECGEIEGESLEQISASASLSADGTLTLTMANLSCAESAEIRLTGVGAALDGECEFALLAADDVHAHNTFENPACVQPVRRTGALRDGDLVTIPAGGVLALTVKR